jgi:hypothetical protein
MANWKKITLALGALAVVGAGVSVGVLGQGSPKIEAEATAVAPGGTCYLLVSGNWGNDSATFNFNFTDGTNYATAAATYSSTLGMYSCTVPSTHTWTQWQILRMSADGQTQWNYTNMTSITGDAMKLYGDPGDASTNFWQTSVVKGGNAFYLTPNHWNTASAVFGVKFYNGDEKNGSVYSSVMTQITGDSDVVFECTVPTGVWIYGKGLRCVNGTTEITSSTTIWNSTNEMGLAGANQITLNNSSDWSSAAMYTYSAATRLGYWGTQFLSQTSTCDSTGATQQIAKTVWDNEITNAWNVMGADVKAVLKTQSSTGTDDLAKACARYDFMVSKYTTGVYANFADRTISGSGSGALIQSSSSEADTATPVLAAVVIGSGLAAGAYFLVRKKHTA